MKAFQIFLLILLDVVVVLSTCGVLVFASYIIFLKAFRDEYWTLLAIFIVLDVCAIILLAGLLHRMTAAAAAVVIGALLHLLLYTLKQSWFSPMFNVSAATDVIVIMIMTTLAYLSAQKSRKTSDLPTPGRARPTETPTGEQRNGFWSSLDQGSKVLIITSLITGLTTIIGSIIGILPNFRR